MRIKSLTLVTLVFSTVFSTLFSTSSFAARPDRDLRNETPLGPVLNQGQSGWCFAYAASDILTTALKVRVSPEDTAVNYLSYLNGADRFLRTIVSGLMRDDYVHGSGSIAGALRSVEKRGVCKDENKNVLEKINNGAQLVELLKDKQLTAQNSCSVRETQTSFQVNVYHGAPLDTTQDSDEPTFVQAIDLALDAGVAAGIEYHVQGLLNPQTRARIASPFASHASSIVARQLVNGKEMYLLRNSWGAACNVYRADLVCDNGNIWLTEKDIDNVALAIVVLQ